VDAIVATDHPAPPSGRRDLSIAHLGAGVCAVGLVVTWLVAELVPSARAHDAAALQGFIDLGRPWVKTLAQHILDVVTPLPCVVFGIAATLVALGRGRPRLALLVPVLMIGPVLTSDTLKPLLAHAHDGIGPGRPLAAASWPSGHATATMAMVLIALLVVPRRARPGVAALGAVFAVAVAFSLLTLAWHMPSDVIGGFLMAGLWISLGVAALRWSERRWPTRSGRRAATRVGRALWERRALAGAEALVPVAVLAGVVLAPVALFLARPHRVADFADTHRSLLLAAAVIAAVAASMISLLAAALRR